MTYEEVVVGGLPPDKNMWVHQCRSELHVNAIHMYSLLLQYNVNIVIQVNTSRFI